MGTESVDPQAPGATDEYCRAIETYLCRKNDGHLIRVVGPSFELVSGWAARGVPLKVAFSGIDRCVERYYRKGPRRRPVKIDFCDADVLDVFDEWRRALGLTSVRIEGGNTEEAARWSDGDASSGGRGPSLPAHLERVVARLTQARATGGLGAGADGTIDRVARELDTARAVSRGLRGAAREALIGRLAALDAELLQTARASIDADARAAIEREADDDLASFRASMAPDAFARARASAIDRLIRERFNLPTIAF